MGIVQQQYFMTFLAELKVWQCIKWIVTIVAVFYFLKEHVFKAKAILSPEERAKRRYLLANTEVMRLMREKDR